MGGILHIAYKLLVNDRAKYAALLVGITFAVFLMIEMTSLFAGILTRSSATVINIGASIWVMDPAIRTVATALKFAPDLSVPPTNRAQGRESALRWR
jgi:putative ABC transport system permease protein